MTNLILKLKDFLLYIPPLLYIFYIIYIRLILQRGNRIFYVQLSITQIIITSLIIIALGWRIYVLLKKLGILGQKPKTNKLMLWLGAKLDLLWEKINQMWIDFLRFFTMNFVLVNKLIIKLAKFLDKHHKKPKFLLGAILVFQVFPKIIVVVTFLLDIFIFKEFYYFYKTLFLLLLPVIYSTLFALLEQYYEDNGEYLQESFQIKLITYEDSPCFKHKYVYSDNYEPPGFVKDIDDFVHNYYLPIAKIDETLRYFLAAKSYYKINWVFLIILCLHVLGWSTILFFGI